METKIFFHHTAVSPPFSHFENGGDVGTPTEGAEVRNWLLSMLISCPQGKHSKWNE